MVKKKKKLKDITLRQQGLNPYKTIKIPLKKVVKDIKLIPIFNQLVNDVNDLVIHTYQFIRLYILYHYNESKIIPDITEKFILNCIRTLGVRDNRGKKSQDVTLANLENFFKEEYKPLLNYKKVSLKNKTFLLPYIATQIYTCISNNIQERFLQHFLRFINKTMLIKSEDKKIDRSELFKFKNQLLKSEKTDEKFNDWITEHKDNILPNEIKKSVHYDLKIKPMKYLKGMLYMNSVLEDKEIKLFQPLPLRNNIIPKHVTFDTASIINLFCPKNKTKGELLKKLKVNQDFVWENILRTGRKVFKDKNYTFNNQILTDGFSCSLLFIRKDLEGKKYGTKIPKVEEEKYHSIEEFNERQLKEFESRNIVGCDPGKRSLVYMADDKCNKLQYTAPQRRKESLASRNHKILQNEKRKNKIIEEETKLSVQNSKTINYNKFKLYLVEKQKLNNKVKEFYQKEVWRKMKFRQYSYGKKSIDKFLNQIKEKFGETILIAYGNWSRTEQMKYFMPTKNKGLRKLIHKKYDTVTVHEFNTSRKCCKCHNDLQYYKDKAGKKVFRLLVCSKCVSEESKQIVFRTRDVNAAVNIMTIAKSWINLQERPAPFKYTSITCSKSNENEKKLDNQLILSEIKL